VTAAFERRDDATIDVVMVGADSLDTICKTHSHYFATGASDVIAALERDLATALGGRSAA
jgi:hypothetical protein